jgi:acyl dehydratase
VSIDSAAVIGVRSPTLERTWTDREALLYALSVGTAFADPARGLTYTTEHSEGFPMRVLPSFATVLVGPRIHPALSGIRLAGLLHASEEICVHRPLPPAGSALASSTVVELAPRSSGALVTIEGELVDASDDGLLVTARWSLLARGETVLDAADPAPSVRAARIPWPETPPKYATTIRTRPDQALLYRLNGDRNPLHSDPAVAARAGFDRPILHGLCTFGSVVAALGSCVADDPGAFGSVAGRFSSTVVSGDELVLEAWPDGTGLRFRARRTDGVVVLDDGRVSTGMEEELG